METEIQRMVVSTLIILMETQIFLNMEEPTNRKKLAMDPLTKETMIKKMIVIHRATPSQKVVHKLEPSPTTINKEILMNKKKNQWTITAKSKKKRGFFHCMKMQAMIKMSMVVLEEMRTALSAQHAGVSLFKKL